MPSITSSFFRAPSRCWYHSGRCSASWPERYSCGTLPGIKSKLPNKCAPKKKPYRSISVAVVRRVSRAWVQPAETVRKPSSEPETTRRDNDAIYDADDPKGVREGRTGRHAGCQGRCCDDEVHRIPAEGGSAARPRWPTPALDGRARLVLRREAPGDRRTLHR